MGRIKGGKNKPKVVAPVQQIVASIEPVTPVKFDKKATDYDPFKNPRFIAKMKIKSDEK